MSINFRAELWLNLQIEASIPIQGGRNLSPVKNSGKVRQCWDLGERGNGSGGPGVGREGEAAELERKDKD